MLRIIRTYFFGLCPWSPWSQAWKKQVLRDVFRFITYPSITLCAKFLQREREREREREGEREREREREGPDSMPENKLLPNSRFSIRARVVHSFARFLAVTFCCLSFMVNSSYHIIVQRRWSLRAHLYGVGMLGFVSFDINQPTLPTPFFSFLLCSWRLFLSLRPFQLYFIS